MLVGHLKWEEEYKQLSEEIKAAAEAEDQEPEEEEGRNKEQDLQNLLELVKRIKQSIRNILRYFHEHPKDFNKLKDIIGPKRSSKINEFVNMFSNHYEICRQRMNTSKEEEDSKAEQLKLLEEKVTYLSDIDYQIKK
jgi:phosphatidate phosphatase PAH1